MLSVPALSSRWRQARAAISAGSACRTPFLEAGLPVFVDKPLACTVAEAIIAAARGNDAALTSFSALRWLPDTDRTFALDHHYFVPGLDLLRPVRLLATIAEAIT